MLNIKPPTYKFCPLCGTKLSFKEDVDKKKRKICPKCGWVYYPHVFSSVHAIIFKKGKVLLVRRGIPPHFQEWNLPAGFIDFGEHPIDTLKREIKEETGLTLIKARFIKITQADDDPRAPGHFRLFYKVVAKGKLKIKDRTETTNIDWFKLNKLPKIAWRQHEEIIKKLQSLSPSEK
ncbi:hypothetical protein A2962_00595 [Candidatus Woesebacteria bacterium RIFCSPLOWO2_01_FULL_39_61]|uniref:Nudix hydrolase domain-containing protein n=1 Tax=Candidatus Woesebacteria bacterium RIFCSPHIGHO2_02_FULL_39_13 TaxID=1802505 RepID=A0A1F7Z1U9_9BACT|nr:MAG: hypothetical protein A2692_04725 [Candidatus Woesebacteria bacterium RIFCSPHIGHO2_01_FULL_39_95]OGM33593.1 MAG: hypothetical protein A3D01_01400 [Candidatus Woesebacteria bacterium RIFCSPHIGHO2_02_FULL_39_13]OGM36677.1 MAG: hypothetical protein A3E13_00090 [Candidatus Woesebacteria bacterium RIFCSPHIGHO2_12_FULL_40_20]OGM68550.1 MAG: hypothetical protein A2962_00595 [Candidatus Woesebacteria bacterium RIFCSPLOWO2_01_FULL_39_61]OGM73431.1 MAG: hypothetical protein A3H19_00745 [Candidatus